ncbi:MAG: MarR family winged helix-turn-helix transcriptional regulator [Pseudomonadota bacterium]
MSKTVQPAKPGNSMRDTVSTFTLETAWSYKVTVLADLVARRVAAVVQTTSGLNLSQWRVLAAVADKPGRTSTEVVDITPMDKPIVSRAVQVLVDRGFLRREASQEDGRRSYLRLTAEGEGTYAAIVEALTKTGAAGLDLLSGGELAAFNRQLDEMITQYRDLTTA